MTAESKKHWRQEMEGRTVKSSAMDRKCGEVGAGGERYREKCTGEQGQRKGELQGRSVERSLE